MAVMCLSFAQQTEIAALYRQRFHSFDRLAEYYEVSPTTIRKVLLEMGEIKHKPVLSVEDGQILRLVRQYNLSVTKLESMIKGHGLLAKNV